MTSTSSGRPRPPKGAHILLVDRCLAPEIAREISKMDGIHGIALAEHYGDEVAQRLADVTFLAEAGDHGWGVLTQNPRMWQVPDERACIVEHRTRVFSLDDPNASKTLKGLVLGRHILSIRRRMRRPDPCFWRLRLQHVRKDLQWAVYQRNCSGLSTKEADLKRPGSAGGVPGPGGVEGRPAWGGLSG